MKDPSTASALFTAQGDMKGRMQCVYCGEHHYSASCIQVKNIDERKGILRRDRRCFACLQRGHRAKECNKANNCRKCHGSHHQSICSIIQSKNENKDKPADQNVEGAAAKSEESLLQPEQVTSTTANTRHRTTHVLLQTATVYAVNPENSRRIKVRVLFDPGSQRSYITSSLKSRLGLSTCKKETVHLNTFAQDQFKKQSCEGVRLDLQGLDGDFVIQSFEFSISSHMFTCRNTIGHQRVSTPGGT